MESIIMLILMMLIYATIILIGIAIVKYLIRYGINYYLKKKNEDKGRE